MKSLVLTIICMVMLTGCSNRPKGTYTGTVTNSSSGQEASLDIVFSQLNKNLSGTVTIGPPLHGGGSLYGSMDGRNIRFTTSDSFLGRIVWMGEVNGNYIYGRYVVEGLLGDKQGGTWGVMKR